MPLYLIKGFVMHIYFLWMIITVPISLYLEDMNPKFIIQDNDYGTYVGILYISILLLLLSLKVKYERK